MCVWSSPKFKYNSRCMAVPAAVTAPSFGAATFGAVGARVPRAERNVTTVLVKLFELVIATPHWVGDGRLERSCAHTHDTTREAAPGQVE